MKKNIKIALLSALLIPVAAFAALETYSYFQIKIPDADFQALNKTAKAGGHAGYTQRYAPVEMLDQNSSKLYKREINTGNNNNTEKNTILFYGGPYVYGQGLDREETVPAKIAEKTGRTVLNRSICMNFVQNMLYDFTNPKFFKKVDVYPKVDYIVFELLNDHMSKIVNPYVDLLITDNISSVYYLNYGFKDDNGTLKQVKPSAFKRFLYSLYTTKAFVSKRSEEMSRKAGTKIFVTFMTDAKKITDKKFPGSKFVILKYKDGSKLLPEERTFELLKEKGFIILDSEEIAGHELESEKWRQEDKEQPSPAANEDVAKGLIKALNL